MVNFAKPGTFIMDKDHAVVGIGEEAFESADHSTIYFRLGIRPVMITSGFTTGTLKPLWPPGQLRALAKVILSRMLSYQAPGALKNHPRFVSRFVPTSSSWLNLMERWFGELTQANTPWKVRRGSRSASSYHGVPGGTE